MKELVKKYIHAHQLLNSHQLVLVALSGGADSVALLHVLNELGYKTHALHCNFHLRNEESDRDEIFVKELCKIHGIPLSVRHFETRLYAEQQHISIEMAARELRYAWFKEELQKTGAQRIAVGHHMNDQAETLLLNLLRGSGILGLAAMNPCRDNIVRPLLCVKKDDILNYLKGINQDYITDSTNLERECIRNIIRLDILPQMEQINPQFISTLSETSEIFQRSIIFYNKGIKEAFIEKNISECHFPIDLLSNTEEAQTLLYEWTKEKGFTKSQLTEILQSERCGKIWLTATHRLLRDRHYLVLKPTLDFSQEIKFEEKLVEKIEDTGNHIAYFDLERITSPIEIRKIKTGDWFVPFGMKGKKLISDFLTDKKINAFEKENQWVAVCGEDIIWVIGHRSDNRYSVTSQTKRILQLKIKQNDTENN